MNANEILTVAAATLDQRGKDYDQPEGERSMERIVETFNVLTGHALTEAQGWQFMAILKLVRMQTAADPTDSAVDCAAYAALAGEALAGAACAPISPPPADAMTALDAGGWIPWAGGERPVDEDANVQYRLRNGWEYFGEAGQLVWDQSCKEYDITAYRIAERKATSQKPERWVPEVGEKYFAVSLAAADVMEVTWMGDDVDRQRAAFGNCYRTREEAEAKRAEILGGK